MPDRIHAAMHAMQPTASQSQLDCPATESDLGKLTRERQPRAAARASSAIARSSNRLDISPSLSWAFVQALGMGAIVAAETRAVR